MQRTTRQMLALALVSLLKGAVMAGKVGDGERLPYEVFMLDVTDAADLLHAYIPTRPDLHCRLNEREVTWLWKYAREVAFQELDAAIQ